MFGQVVNDSTFSIGLKDTTQYGNFEIKKILNWHFSYENPDKINDGINLNNSFPVDILDFEEIKKSEKWKNYGWFEAEFSVDSTLSGLPFELTILNEQAINVWLNGKLVLKSGNPSKISTEEVLSSWPDFYYKDIFFREGKNYFLLEYSDHTISKIIVSRNHFTHGIDIRLLKEHTHDIYRTRGVIFGGVSTLLILLILINSYLAYNFKKEYHAYVILTTIFIFLHAFSALSYTLIDWTFTYQYFNSFIDSTAFIFVLYFYLISIRKFYDLSIPWKPLSICFGFFLIASLYSVVSSHGLINIINPVLGISTFIFGFYSLYEAKKKSPDNSITAITTGFVFTVGGALLYAIFYKAFEYHSNSLLITATIFAYTAIPISLTFNVVQGYAKLFKTLDIKVKERTAELEASNEFKSKFFANISHEFRTPLTISEGLVKKVVNHRNEDVFVKKELGVVSKNLSRLHNMVDQIIDLTKSDESHLTLQKKYYNADGLATISVESFRSLAENHNHRFEFYPAAAEAVIHADRAKVEIIINNLISNALKFTPKGGNIEIRTWVEDDQYYLSVKDSGPGIPIEEEEAIFERFHRIHRSDEDYVEGMGVGLELSRSMAQLHRGNIIAESNQEVGALFILKLPVQDSPQQTVIEELEMENELHSNENVQEEVSKKKNEFSLLLVEDNEDMMHYVSGILEPLGTIHTANNGVEAIEVLKKITPDIIISDLMMPKMGGQKLVKHLAEHKDWKNIPVVVLTAKALEEDKLNLLRIGVVDYITKPFLPEQLMLKARNLLRFYQQKEKIKVTVANEELLKVEGFKEDVAAYIFENIEDSTMSVERLAKHFSQSRRSLYRNLQLEVGMTPAEFIREVRLTTAQTMVANNNMRLDELARAVGYKTSVGFKRAYKERFGGHPLG